MDKNKKQKKSPIAHNAPHKINPVHVGIPTSLPVQGVYGKERRSRGEVLISRLKSPRDMIILSEIIGPPKGLR